MILARHQAVLKSYVSCCHPAQMTPPLHAFAIHQWISAHLRFLAEIAEQEASDQLTKGDR